MIERRHFHQEKERNERSGFYGFGRSFLLTELSLEQADDRRNQRQHENRNDDQLEMLLYGRDAAEEVAEQREQGGPAQALSLIHI